MVGNLETGVENPARLRLQQGNPLPADAIRLPATFLTKGLGFASIGMK